jgi:hypothetical protein
MDVDDLLSSGGVLVISGRAKDGTGVNHASAFSPVEMRPEIQGQKSTFGTKYKGNLQDSWLVDGRP